ncbi:hypothetical protein ABK040_002524 [Willaertia magna]
MSFTSRAARDFSFSTQKASTTEEQVGPGSYFRSSEGDFKKLKGHRHALAPFSSTQKRKTLSYVSNNMETPGPGSYYINDNNNTDNLNNNNPNEKVTSLTFKKKKPQSANGSVFKSKTVRFGDSSTLVPGPGAYHTVMNKEFKRENNSSPPNHGASITLQTQQQPTTKLTTAPSIPSAEQSYGYEETEDGQLVRHLSPNKGYTGNKNDKPGPGEYYNNNENTTKQLTTSSKGMGIFSSSTKREIFKVSGNPGPGAYDGIEPEQLTTNRIYTSVFGSKTERQSIFDPPKRVNATSHLGPGTYNVPLDTMNNKQQVTAGIRPFGSTSARPFDLPSSSNTPGPGAYESKKPRNQLQAFGPISTPGIHGPFFSTTGRFVEEKKSSNVAPGPGKYLSQDILGVRHEVSKKIKGSYGVFGSTSKRFVYGEKEKGPPVGSYNPKPETDVKRNDQRTSIFQSKSKRTTFPEKKITTNLPVSYVGHEEWIKKTPNKHPSQYVGFASASPRFKDKDPESLALTMGPGYYYKGEKETSKTLPLTKSKRFAEWIPKDKIQMPGPGTYIDPTAENWIKPSFNVSLQNDFVK